MICSEITRIPSFQIRQLFLEQIPIGGFVCKQLNFREGIPYCWSDVVPLD